MNINRNVPSAPHLMVSSFSYASSDEAIAAFVETSGELLQVLSLNNVKKV